MKHGIRTAAALLMLAGCRGDVPPDQTTGSIDSAAWEQARTMPADVRAALDSGNAAFRADDFDAARTHYQRAIALRPEESAPWFGLAMAERQLGNIAAADSAMARVRALAPGASLVHPSADDTLPAGHR